jgi:AraC family transcriptional regulator of adaptative response / DNA-3-methyladenine glycosylase II
VEVDAERVWRAIEARDPRFDGWVFCAVKTTGIDCRPSCPARTPKRENVRFFVSAAAAKAAGFRACKRCRASATPGSPEWDLRADLVGRAIRLIADGVVDREGVGGLARRLGYTERHVHRQLVAVVGAGPLALARAQRAQAARSLLETTTLSIIDVTFASGFQSVRQFSATIQEVFALTPSALRARAQKWGRPEDSGALSLRLPSRLPLEAEALVAFLERRVVPGVEEVLDGAYRRSLRLPHGHELAVRAVLGQQVSLRGASTLASRLVADYGQKLERPLGAVTHAFPTADVLADTNLASLGMPAARRRGLSALVTALAAGDLVIDAGADRVDARRRLLELPGIGPWTADYIAMRALHDPDAFLPSDLGVRHALEQLGQGGRPATVVALAESWRPYRAYAVQHLWASLDHGRGLVSSPRTVAATLDASQDS